MTDSPDDRSEESLRHKERQIRSIFENAAVGIAVVDTEGRFVEFNETWQVMLGYRRQELLDLGIGEITPAGEPVILPAEMTDDQRYLRLEKRYRRKDGSEFWGDLWATVVRGDDGAVEGMIGIIIDITERKRVEQRLALQSTALESAASAIVITDPEGVIEWVNPAFTGMTGYEADEAIGAHTRILKSERHPPDVYTNLWQTISAGEVWSGELVNRRKDGSFYTEEMTITPVLGNDGDIEHFIAVKQDVTDRRRMEEQLLQAQKMEAVGRLAGGVAHDFNNLLQAMLGLTELVKRPGTSVKDALTKLSELEGLIQRASQLTRQLLLFSRRETAHEEALELNQVVEETALLLNRLLRETIDISFEAWPEPLALEADRGQLEQIVVNLAVNAADAMPDGGRLRLRTGATDDGMVWLEVEDDGHGIPETIREHLFEPFFTTKERSQGTGLGLAVVHGIVSRRGGRVEVESEVGEGSTFRIFLPAADASVLARARANGRRSAAAGGDERVLIVEDDPAVRESLAEILNGLGYRVTTAGGLEAADSLPEDEAFDLLLSDFGLPDGVGTDVAALLQERWPALAVIIMSGYAEEDVIARQMTAGDLHFLQKPFTVQTLAQAVRSVLSQRRHQPAD